MAIYLGNDKVAGNGTSKQEEQIEVILYEDGATAEDIILEDSITNYDYIEIFYRHGSSILSGSKKFCIVPNLENYEFVLDEVLYINSFVQCISSVIHLNDKTLTRVRTAGTQVNINTKSIIDWSGTINIIKIVGYKK